MENLSTRSVTRAAGGATCLGSPEIGTNLVTRAAGGEDFPGHLGGHLGI